MKTLAIIPARAGSKGLRSKNILPLLGQPLVAWTVEAAMRAKSTSRVIVSSDSSVVLDIAAGAGAETLQRPAALATSKTTAAAVVQHCLESLHKTNGWAPALIVLLQPTSPLRTASDIDRATALFKHHHVGAVIAVYEPACSPYKCFYLNDQGYLQGIVDNESPFKRRQDLPRAMQPNGAIYAIRTQEFVRNKSLFAERTAPFLMPAARSIDIDSIDDLRRAEALLAATAGRSKRRT